MCNLRISALVYKSPGPFEMKGLVFMLQEFQGIGIDSYRSWSIPSTIKCNIRVLLSSILARLVRFALAHPRLKASALAWVNRYPALESWLHRFSAAKGIIAGRVIVQEYSERSKLTPSALAIYDDLKSAIERHENGRK